MPPPVPPPAQPVVFNSTVQSAAWPASGGDAQRAWAFTPAGLCGGSPLSDAFLVAPDVSVGATFSLQADVLLVTRDGNPTSTPGNATRFGSAAAIVFRAADAA